MRLFGYLFLALFILQLHSVSPAFAQLDIPTDEEVEPVEVIPPAMAYQPPADADEMRDFAPPDAEVETLAADLEVKTTTPFDASKNSLVTIGDETVGVYVEDKTFNEAVTLEFKQIEIPQPTIGTVGEDPKDPAPPITATNTISDPLDTQDLIRFTLDIVSTGKAEAIAAFDKPVRLVVDLRSLFPKEMNPVLSNYFLAYQDEKDPTMWHDVPINIYAGGIISADVMHFSNWASGVRPERWNPSWNPPAVSEFSGAATYSYPIEVPPGRGGLQPNVTLSYSTKGLDGLTRTTESGPIANAWSIGDISITRVGVKLEIPYDGTAWTKHPDKFRLVFGGTGYELYPVGSTSGAEVRYYVKDAPGMYVKRVYSTATPNQDGMYWIVITPDGTRYRLGYKADAEEWQHASIYHMSIDGHQGRPSVGADSWSAIAWHVDTVTDVYGNQMTYHYHTRQITEGNSWVNVLTNQWEDFDVDNRVNRIQTIKYNYSTRVTAYPVPDTVDQLTSTPATRIEFRPSNTVNGEYQFLINSIFIYHGNSSLPTHEYRIASESRILESPGCVGYGNEPKTTTTRVVTSIRHWVGTDGDATTNDSGYALPATTFTYNNYRHYTGVGGAGCSFYPYLTQYQNGYGGTVTFTYVNDNRQVGTYDYNWGTGVATWPTIGYNLKVTNVAINDGFNTVQTGYAYTTPCYGQTEPAPSGATLCPSPDSSKYGNIVGHQTTTRTSYAFNGSSILNKQVTTFSLAASTTIGQPTQIDVYSGGSILMSQTKHYYTSEPIGGISNLFTYKIKTTTEKFSNGAGSTSISSKVQYAYDKNYQLDETTPTQFGNLTHIWEFDNKDATVAYRTTRRWYDPNTTAWIVSKPRSEGLYEGGGWNFISGTWNYYDDSSDLGDEPTKGFLTHQRQAIEIDCAEVEIPSGGGQGCDRGFKTIDTSYVIDDGGFGNVWKTITYSDFGYRTVDATPTELTSNFASDGRITTITYDQDYHLYPVKMSNVVDQITQTTRFDVYGFKDANNTLVALNSYQKQPGLLARVITVNQPNSLTTAYEYDPFGRLYQMYEPGDSQGALDNQSDGTPAIRYRYWDNSWNNSGQIWGNPASPTNKPFGISVHTRPNQYTSSGPYVMKHMTYYDGLGRPIQEQEYSVSVGEPPSIRTIVTTTAYNALGQATCVTTPYDIVDAETTWPNNNFQTTPCTNKDHTTTLYTNLGQPSLTTAPDSTKTATIYGLNSTYTLNAEFQLHAAFSDNFGRLKAIDETVANYSNPLDSSSDLAGWTVYGDGTVSANNGYATVTHQGASQFTGMRRTLNLGGQTNPEMGVSFSVRTNNSNGYFQIYLASGTWDTSNFRLWSLEMGSGNLRLLEWEGDSNINNRTVTDLMPAKKVGQGFEGANPGYVLHRLSGKSTPGLKSAGGENVQFSDKTHTALSFKF